jgi:hypothetical protein
MHPHISPEYVGFYSLHLRGLSDTKTRTVVGVVFYLILLLIVWD